MMAPFPERIAAVIYEEGIPKILWVLNKENRIYIRVELRKSPLCLVYTVDSWNTLRTYIPLCLVYKIDSWNTLRTYSPLCLVYNIDSWNTLRTYSPLC